MLMDRVDSLLQSYRRDLMRHEELRYDGRVTLLWPVEDIEQYRKGIAAGWNDVAAEVETHLIPGGHVTCATRYVGELASALGSCLANTSNTLTTRDYVDEYISLRIS